MGKWTDDQLQYLREHSRSQPAAAIAAALGRTGGIRLPANVDAVLAVLAKQKVKCGRDQAERVAWRILKDWVAAQMAILESEMV